jgi:predicted aconitase
MINELLAADLRMSQPFTVDPRPLDFKNIHCGFLERCLFLFTFRKQARYERQLIEFGLKNQNSFTCTSYLPEVGNIPDRDTILAWSESSAVVFANSVLGTRTNRNSSGMDLLCNILGKAPLFGLLTDKGRRATCRIQINTSSLPDPQLLGDAIGLRAGNGVPYIVGLDKFLGPGLNNLTIDYLKDMGAASASRSAVGLYHVDSITPEAVDTGPEILLQRHQRYEIDDKDLERLIAQYPVLWKDRRAAPALCFIGCPHLSLNQLYNWTDDITGALRKATLKNLSISTILCVAPDVVEKFRADNAAFQRLIGSGAKLSSICPAVYMTSPLFSKKPVITNSNKLRSFSSARFFPGKEILSAITGGKIKGKG